MLAKASRLKTFKRPFATSAIASKALAMQGWSWYGPIFSRRCRNSYSSSDPSQLLQFHPKSLRCMLDHGKRHHCAREGVKLKSFKRLPPPLQSRQETLTMHGLVVAQPTMSSQGSENRNLSSDLPPPLQSHPKRHWRCMADCGKGS